MLSKKMPMNINFRWTWLIQYQIITQSQILAVNITADDKLNGGKPIGEKISDIEFCNFYGLLHKASNELPQKTTSNEAFNKAGERIKNARDAIVQEFNRIKEINVTEASCTRDCIIFIKSVELLLSRFADLGNDLHQLCSEFKKIAEELKEIHSLFASTLYSKKYVEKYPAMTGRTWDDYGKKQEEYVRKCKDAKLKGIGGFYGKSINDLYEDAYKKCKALRALFNSLKKDVGAAAVGIEECSRDTRDVVGNIVDKLCTYKLRQDADRDEFLKIKQGLLGCYNWLYQAFDENVKLYLGIDSYVRDENRIDLKGCAITLESDVPRHMHLKSSPVDKDSVVKKVREYLRALYLRSGESTKDTEGGNAPSRLIRPILKRNNCVGKRDVGAHRKTVSFSDELKIREFVEDD